MTRHGRRPTSRERRIARQRWMQVLRRDPYAWARDRRLASLLDQEYQRLLAEPPGPISMILERRRLLSGPPPWVASRDIL